MLRPLTAPSETRPMPRRLGLLVGLATMHTALLITSRVAGAKLVALPFGLSASATVLSYTLTFVILDTIAELYGAAVSRFVINMGLAGMMLAAGYLEAAAVLPPAPGFSGQDAFAEVLSASWRIWLAGWSAYAVSQRLDLWTYLLLKRTPAVGTSIVARAAISLTAGQLVDTAVFVTIAFAGSAPLVPVILGQYAVKLAFASVSVPLVGVAVALSRRFLANADAEAADSIRHA
jgi:uncharacterized integral membrane protein (TIGR00697 family)